MRKTWNGLGVARLVLYFSDRGEIGKIFAFQYIDPNGEYAWGGLRIRWNLARRVPLTYDTLRGEVKHSYYDISHSQEACFLRFSLLTQLWLEFTLPDRTVVLEPGWFCWIVTTTKFFTDSDFVLESLDSSSEFVLILVSLIFDELRTYLGKTYICRQKSPWVDVRRCTRMLPKLKSIKVAPDIIRSQQIGTQFYYSNLYCYEYDVKFLMALLQNGEAQEKSSN